MSTLDAKSDGTLSTVGSPGAPALVVVSGDTAQARDAAAAELAGRLRRLQAADLPDAAYTLAVGRRARSHRRAVICHGPQEAARLLEASPADGDGGPGTRTLVLELPADVPDVARLAAEAINTDPRFAGFHRACRRAGALKKGAAGAVFAYQYALVRLWLHWGLQPRALRAEGVGETVAACVGGALSLADAVVSLGEPEAATKVGRRARRRPSFEILPFGSGSEPEDLVLTVGSDNPLETLRRAWLSGAEIEWENVYEGQGRRRIRLPDRSADPRPEPEAEAPEGNADRRAAMPWVLAAKSKAALRRRAAEVGAAVEARSEQSPLEIARSLAVDAAADPAGGHRAVVVGTDRADLLRGLTALSAGRPSPGVTRGVVSVTDSRPVFVFPGHGSQWQGMAADLMESSPVFRAEADRCAEAFAPHIDWSLTDVLCGRPGSASLERVDVVQPALFTVMVSLHALLRSWGLRPAAVLGHCIGEMAAAYVSGALSVQDAAAVSAHSSKAQATLAGAGAMASVELPPHVVRERLAGYDGRIGLGAVNGVDWVLVSGDRQDVVHLVEELTAEGVRARLIRVDLAVHSTHLDAVRDRMMRDLASITPRPAELPMRSSISGEPLRGTELDNSYWFGNVRETVEFAGTVRTLVEEGYRTFVELSPHPALAMGVSSVLEAAGAEADGVVVGTLRRSQDGQAALLASLAELHVRGVPVDWTAVLGGAATPVEPLVPTCAGDPAPVGEWAEGEGLFDRLAEMPRAAAERECLGLIAAHAAALLGVDSLDDLAPDWAGASLVTLGFTSLLAVELRGRLAQDTGLRLARTLVFDHPTPQSLSRFLVGELSGATGGEATTRLGTGAPAVLPAEARDGAIAIVGMAARLPGAADLEEYWDLLSGGREAIARFTDEELLAAGVPEELVRDPRYVKAFGALPDAELFDAAFFGLTPAEAEVTDPQQRLFLQTCHAALEHAGCDPARHPGAIGVFGGAANNTYLQENVLPGTDRTTASEYFRVMFANDKDYLATRVAYKLNLKGPGYTVQTACSTSLVAIHVARQALRVGDCDLALAGGVSVRVPQTKGHLYEEGSILSADGRVRAFDADASGTVFGSGVGVLALKRLSDAVADGDTIHAVILGTATNNDGAGKVSYAAPARDGQAAVIAMAQRAAGADAGTITYLEAHATGTRLGDPVEVAALDQAFRRTTTEKGYCAIGSVKPNIGHLDAAAGVAGVIKVVLMMQHRTIPPSINYRRPNPAIDFENTPFRVAAEFAPWTVQGHPRRAGVSSFGVGGTNAHAVLEEAPPREPSGQSRADQLLVLSAATPSALDRIGVRLAEHLRRHPDVPVADVAHTLAVGRAAHRYRRALLCRDTDEAVRLLEDPTGAAGAAATAGYVPPSVAFAFPGAGADADGRLAAVLTAAEPVFAERYEECIAAGALRGGPRGRAFAFGYALAGLWQDWGMQPETLFAEGDGELVAACLAGALRLDEAVGALAGAGMRPPGREARLRVLPLAEASREGQVVLEARAESPLIAVREAWLVGADVDWARFYRGQRRSRVPLPTYPFEGRRYWLEPAPPAPAPAEPPLRELADARRSCPTITLTGREPYLADHLIGGAAVLPAAVHLELARAAAELVSGGRTVEAIRDAGFEQMLSFRSGARTLRVRWEPRNGRFLRFTVTADGTESDGGGEQVYSRGEVALADSATTPAPAPERVDLDRVLRRCTTLVDPGTCYDLLGERGVAHGTSLRALREFRHRGGQEAVAVLDVPQSAAGSAAPDFGGPDTSVLHPALLDGALQAAVCLLAVSGEDRGATYLPMRLGELRLHGPLDGPCTVHVTRSAGAPRSGGDQVVRLDLALVDQDGAVAVGLSDLVLRRVPSGAEPSGRTEPAPVFLRGHWSPVPAAGTAAGIGSGPFLLLADGEGPRHALRRALRDAGEHDTPVVLVTPGPGFRRTDDHTYEVAPGRPGAFAELLAALDADRIAPRRILHTWSLTAQPSDEFGADLLDTGVGSLFDLTRALLARRPVERTQLLFVHPLAARPLGPDEGLPVHEAVAAFARTARLENPALAYRVAGVAADGFTEQIPLLLGEFGADTDRETEVRYEEDLRLARRYQVIDTAGSPGPGAGGGVGLRDGGVYLITGGAGGLGLLHADHLAARYRAHLFLVGRSAPDERVRARTEALAAAGGTARYLRADVSRQDDVRAVLAAVEAEHETLHGVIHSAGVLRDSFLLTKTQEDLAAVLAPKVHGTVHLDRLTAHHSLDFFATFSSVVAPLGNVGQADYAFANAFMDGSMAHRQRLVAAGRRSGTSVSIAWPLWRDGGMTADEASAALLERRQGSAALPAQAGLAAFETALGLPGGPVLVALGDPATVQAALTPAAPPTTWPDEPDPGRRVAAGAEPEPDLRSVAEGLLREILAAQTRLDAATIDPQAPLERYGIDSLLIVKLNTAVEERFGESSKTLFFEYTTLADLADYFADHHAERLRELSGAARPAQEAAPVPAPVRAPAASPAETVGGDRDAHHRYDDLDYPDDAIAVIGLSGRYPKAADLEVFWQNLVEGRDCVTEIPRERWDHDRFFQEGPPVPGRAYAKWGGFLDDVDRFDPLFFGISPREAELMDPQERLFLQTAWHAVEDAGYRPAELAGRPVGVFVGAMYAEYQLYGADRVLRGEGPVPGSLQASIANRVSYVLNLAGPSLAVDTMCSSSLTAIHLACRSLSDGESELAIAGGVNLSLHPHKYVYLSQGRFVSADGRCRSFGAGGTGYVPGEGVGAVLLKPVRRALADGDHIHGVILGDAVNHGGRTNGYTVPNPNAQQKVVERALQRARTAPRDIGYVEAHGTGTSLGDPIEITGLRKAFEQVGGPADAEGERQYCPVGSLKSNIGHLEAAAGIAGLTKVLLQFRHGSLVPSLHSEELNPNIDFAASPFRVQRELADWPRPYGGSRRAALSSFGAGGSNAHLVLAEEPRPEPAPALPAAGQRTPEPLLYVLSARDEERLREYAGRLGRFLRTERVDLADVAHTLRYGREPMAERLAVVGDDGAAVAEALLAFSEGADAPAGLWHGRAGTGPAPDPDPDAAGVGPQAAAHRWLAGADPVETAFPVSAPNGAGRPPRRIPLPGYPFARERYWLGGLDETPAGAGAAALHPLLDANESTLTETRFRTTLRRDDALLEDHQVAGRRLLAGTALLEMVRAAVERAAGSRPTAMRDVMWGRPVEVTGDALDVFVALRADGAEGVNPAGAVEFEVFSEAGQDRVTHVRGAAATGPEQPAGPPLDLAAVRHRCATARVGTEVYRDYRQAGFHYGPSFQVMREVRIGADEVLVEVRLPERPADTEGFTLHPALLDGLLRSVHWMNRHTTPGADDLVVPFSLGAIEVLRPLPPVCFAHAVPSRGSGPRPAAVQRFDVLVVDEQGAELVRIRDFAGRVLSAPAEPEQPTTGETPAEALFYEYGWEPQGAPEPTGPADPDRGTLLVLAAAPEPARLLARSGRWARVVRVATGDRFHAEGPDEYTVDPLDAGHYRRLLAEVADGGARSALDVLHLLDLTPGGGPQPDDGEPAGELARLNAALDTGLFPMLYLAQAARPGHGRLRLLYGHTAPAGRAVPAREATSGLCRVVEAAQPGSWLRSVRYDGPAPDAERLARTLLDEFAVPTGAAPRTAEIRYDESGRRLVRVVRSATPSPFPADVPLRDGGVYLITGGTSGIGLVFARYLAEQYRARLVLLARSPLGEAARAEVDRLTALGAEVLAVQGDVAVPDDVRRALARLRDRFGRLDGVFHAAGVFDPTPLPEADRERFARVLAAKTRGTVNLDVLTRDERLDLFVLFSSVSAALGDFGAGSYAAANRFLDGYAERRDQWAAEGRRHGRTLSLDWPLWTVGGVDSALGDAEVSRYRTTTGMRPVTADDGLRMFRQAWAHTSPVLIPAAGDRAVIDRVLGVAAASGPAARPVPAPAPAAGPGPAGQLRPRLVEHVRQRLAEVLKLPPARLDSRSTLDSYGMDSVLVMEANSVLGRDFPGLPGTLFFEYRTVAEVADYLLLEHSDAVVRLFGQEQAPAWEPADPVPAANAAPAGRAPTAPTEYRPPTATVPVIPASVTVAEDDIAIIGISGRYPKARDLDEFWENLRAGRDCVTEVPADRWDAEAVFDPDPSAAGRSYSRWGGFLDDVDAFDSLFFRISPMQAKTMDPQERLFLETAWAALEDAGYPLDALPRPRFSAEGRDVGVFVGVMWGDYAVLAAEESFRGNPVTVLTNRSSIANHVSYFGDFRGPSMVVDTACSSSLVALHLACESIRRGECGYAIAGGVNIAAHPARYVHLSRLNMLAKDGRCRSFGAGGSGYVPGEGVGAVLLKRLSQAEADGDRIHAVVRASAVNQGGHTSGPTVPNPRAQQALVEETLARAGVDPRTIGYVEAHGTGTELGDPIEHTALERAFRRYTDDLGFCALGSAKSAIGHLEGAAGIAGVTKAVLQLRHGQLAPSLHADRLNPVIDFERSPFRVQRELVDWQPPSGSNGPAPRRAAVSSFGAGGTNAHVILEEYLGAPDRHTTAAPGAPGPELLTLSARSEDRLRAQAEQLAAFLRRESAAGRPPALADVAHTFQAGREAMTERLAATVHGIDEAVELLEAFVRGEAGDRVIRSSAKANEAVGDLLTAVREGRDLALALAAAGDFDRLGRLWASGLALDPDVLQQVRPRPARRVSLPTYPFAPERHWIVRRPAGTTPAGPTPALHRRRLDSTEPVLRDHMVLGRSILPGVAHLDLVLTVLSAPVSLPRVLRDVRWTTPVDADAGFAELVVRTEPDTDGHGGAVRYEIRGGGGGTAALYSQGLLADAEPRSGADAVSVEEVRARCLTARTGGELYAQLAGQGLRYGPYFRAVEQVWTGVGEALARLVLPAGQHAGTDRHILHPGMADAALHTLAALLDPGEGALLPFAVERMELLRPVPATGWSHVRARGGHRYDVELLDDTGRVCVRFDDLACRPARGTAGQEHGGYEQFGYRPRWVPAPAPGADTAAGRETVLLAAPASARTLALALGDEHLGRGDEVRHLWLAADGTFERSAEDVLAQGAPPGLVYFLGGAQDASAGGEARTARDEVVALHRLARRLLGRGAGDAGSGAVRLKVVTTDAFPFCDDEGSRPWSAGLWGYCSVLDKEFPVLRTVLVDVRGEESGDAVTQLVAEPFPVRARAVSLRGGVRRTLRLEPVELPSADAGGQVRFRDNGVYLLLGGLGAIGHDTALHLARTHRAKLVLVGRTEPDERRRARIAEIERAGAEVLYLACDAADPAALGDAVTRAKQRFGALHGVFHSAMLLDAAPVRELGEEALRTVLTAKVDTTWNLARAVWDEPLDFLLLYSSGTAIAGNAGQAGYAAGCAFADSLARHLARTARFPVRTLNWGYWHAGGDEDREAVLRRLVAAGIRPIGAEEGMETVERFLASGLPQILATRASEPILGALGVDPSRRVRPHNADLSATVVDAGAQPLLTGTEESARIGRQAAGSDALERLGQLLLLGTFQRAGLLCRVGERRSVTEMRRGLGVVSRHHRLYEVLLDVLELGGLVRRDGDEVLALPPVEGEEARRVLADPEAARAELPAGQPWTAAVAGLLLRCTRELGRVLAGTTAATEVLFPGGSLDAVTAVYQGNPITDRLNAHLAATVRSYAERRLAADPTALIRVLEVGAGTGSTTRQVLAALESFAGQVQYTYTDISTGFVRHGRQEFGDNHPFTDFRVLDIEGDLGAQGFLPQGYDVVLGTNVFHATRRIHDTLNQVKRLLRPAGLLLANEGIRADHVLTLVFGLTDGWWAYEDPEHRIHGTPMLGERSWRDVLHDCGFRRVVTHGLPQEGEVTQSLIVAESDGVLVDAAAVPTTSAAPGTAAPAARSTVGESARAEDGEDAEGRYVAAEEFVRRVFGGVLEMSPEQLDPDATFENYGVDSLVVLQLNKAIEQHVGRVPATLLFEQITMGRLARWLLAERPEALAHVLPATTPDTGPAGAEARIQRDAPSPDGAPAVRPAGPGLEPSSGAGAPDPSGGELDRMVSALPDAEVDALLRLLGHGAANGRVTAE
ncbi:type I polyketide synthase [Streptomyces sp. SID12501]|uniref:SDR family NAD(P)-dependent oxidoreductase n=1 Tax=Streptomyces sp. SID12501 TaxID=2706042 RepID=A0A6B3C3R8_9ACTN|nr:type I polyketide synthase [Streptomyces sp. SID12501]NEC91056.1 SDR family NAD(P)-dependent oxidoreductase [Streptomyces sp. SID12501]